MTDYIERVAELLKNGEDVILYTVGTDTFLSIKELKSRFGLLPTAVCDKDPHKQGRTWKGLEGLIVQSPENIMQQIPKAYWLISSLNYRFQIIGYLTEECGIAADRIVNYVPVRKFKSCLHLNQSIKYDCYDKLTFCCNVDCPKVPSEDPVTAAADLRILRNLLLKAIEKGSIPPDSQCAACGLIKEDYYPIAPKGVYFNYFGRNICNYHCSYCVVTHEEKAEEDAGRHTVGEIVKALRHADMLSDDYALDFVTAGEPTLHAGRREVYQEFDGDKLGFVTNGFLFDPDLFDLMNHKKVYVMTSIDAGTRELYRQIKGVDGFGRVLQNMKKYAQASIGITVLKYLFIPGINDNLDEVDGFIHFCEETDTTLAIVAVDYYTISNITEQTKRMAAKLVTELAKKGILCIPFSANSSAQYSDIVRLLVTEEH